MPVIRISDGRKTNWSGSPRLAPICTLLAVFAAVPLLRAQHYQDLYDFLCTTGCTPYGTLKQGANGNLYGTTPTGGANNLGTIFMVSLAGAYTDLFDFDATTGAGGGGLTLATLDGNFYGTTANTLFSFNPSTNAFAIVYTFSGTDGIPQGPPVEAKDFNLYGLGAIHGGNGTAYRWTISTGTFELLPGSVPGFPSGPLVAASDGFLYGATGNGGHLEAGELFRLNPTTGAIKKLYAFTDESDGASPNAPLTQGKDGNLYGTAYNGGYYHDGIYGTIYEVTLPSDGFAAVYQFDGGGGAGTNPSAGLLAASDGNFYGTTYYGGMSGLGTIFEWQPSGGSYIPLDDFSGNGGLVSGASPTTALMEDSNGLFYGLTPSGGANGEGVFYTVTPPNPSSHINVCCNWFVVLDQPVMILGQNLSQVFSVDFGSVTAQFQPESDTNLLAYVPSAAIDSPITVTFETGLQLETEQSVHILPKIANLDPPRGRVGTQVDISGGGFAETTEVTFDGVAATNFTVVNPGLIQATVPPGATTGKVGVVTPNGSAKSSKRFTVN
jgi:uncharacterized repeat protein (TIGR03803 family)